ncbi:hypothetical protein BWI93_26870 [Siphonobacter sp. BAB-5385]|uniref:hypothetical protein n=1 Tax=Siphonobacter sp. BAB-5385 TaxID=1864822 RepID=UPI000B9E0C9D|nr:hypothetical protein [Siphonobacter sp. BAB-5385]OZI05171.1 hypothetical protein BWI93_26870 [Siphonobacter sp. BAB-5385]
MYKLFTPLFFLISVLSASAQMGIGTSTPHAGAALDITSDDKALLIPRVTQANRPGEMGGKPAIPGMVIYQIDGEAGFYVFDREGWVKMLKPLDAKPDGYIFATGYLALNNVVTANPGVSAPLLLQVNNSSPYLSGLWTEIPLYKPGTYSIEYDVTPIIVDGNQYQVHLITSDNNGQPNGIVPNSVQTSNPGNPKVRGRAFIYATAGTKISLAILPYPNTATTTLTFDQAYYHHKISLTIIRQ